MTQIISHLYIIIPFLLSLVIGYYIKIPDSPDQEKKIVFFLSCLTLLLWFLYKINNFNNNEPDINKNKPYSERSDSAEQSTETYATSPKDPNKTNYYKLNDENKYHKPHDISEKHHSFTTPNPDIKILDELPVEQKLQEERYELNSDGTVNDTELGLMWLHCPVNAQTTEILGDKLAISSRCDFQNHLYTWEEAYQKAMNFSFSKYNDWRLPTIEELQSLHDLNSGDATKGLAYINRDSFPMQNCNDNSFSCIYWSSSSNNAINYAEPDNNKTWVTVSNNSMHLVRLVRTITQ